MKDNIRYMKRYALALALLVPLFAITPEIDKSKALGNPSAPIVMEVFASYDCPHCKDFHDTTIPMIVRDYVNAGKLYLVSREFPLAGQYHPYAREAAEIAVAAGRVGKYQEVADALFRTQSAWGQTGKVWESVASALTPAEQKKVQALVKDPGVVAEVQREYDSGVSAGVNSTPTVFVSQGSKRYPINAQQLHYGFLKSLLDGMLK
jgi:protein-disulfide isomerase